MTDPGQVYLNVSGDKAVLTITEVTIEHFGNYSIWTGNEHGGWREEELVFNLKAQSMLLYPHIIYSKIVCSHSMFLTKKILSEVKSCTK